MLSLDSSLALERVPNSMRSISFTNSAGGWATPTVAAIRKPGPQLHTQQFALYQRLHTATRISAQLRESNDPIAASVLASDTNEDLIQAAADALDPERTSASLGYTWLTHWKLIEEDRRFRQLVFQSTRGRQQQRQQQVFDLVGVENTTNTSSSSIDEAPYRPEDEIRIVHGRLSVVSGAETIDSNHNRDTAVLQNGTDTGIEKIYEEDEEGIDDLTWLASHPEAEATEFSLNFDDINTDNSNNGNDLSAAISTSTSGSSSGGGLKNWPVKNKPLLEEGNDSTDSRSRNTVNTSTSISSSQRDLADTQSAAVQAVLPGAVQLQLGAEVATVRPLWISIYLEESTGTAKLFESVVPLQTEIVDKMSIDLTPFCSVSGLEFGALADLRYGQWQNYFVGLVGDVAVEEADILWPNQVLHRDRVLYNVRGAGDVAKFLADPRKEDVEAHAENLKRLQEERGYRKGWCWYMLRSRWGERVLKTMEIDPNKM